MLQKGTSSHGSFEAIAMTRMKPPQQTRKAHHHAGRVFPYQQRQQHHQCQGAGTIVSYPSYQLPVINHQLSAITIAFFLKLPHEAEDMLKKESAALEVVQYERDFGKVKNSCQL